jgi:ABC-type dipeptide/oligopeptide/nickel transport system permease component
MPFAKFLLRRLLAIPVTLLIITAVLYAIVMVAPPEERAALYFPPRQPSILTAKQIETMTNRIIAEHGLDQPYPVQYINWLRSMLRGDWGWSPTFNADVLQLLLIRTPVTAELTFYSILLLIPLGLISGVIAGWRRHSRTDALFRFCAFLGTSIPPFILGLLMMSIFYVGLYWFPVGRSSILDVVLRRPTFTFYTGFLTIDGLLNGRPEVTLDALRHLAMPVITLSLAHWATLGRVTRAAMVEQIDKEYIVAARSRGLHNRSIIWRHAFRNVLLPALTSSSLSAAALITGVFVVEVIFSLRGLSELITKGMGALTPDTPLALGFAVYSVLLVLPIMFVLDLLKALADPRISEGELA